MLVDARISFGFSMPTTTDFDLIHTLRGQRVAFVGKLGGVNRREAQQLVRRHGGNPVDSAAEDVDLIVIGADQLPLGDQEDLLDDTAREAVAAGRIEIITETQLWERLGWVDGDGDVRRLYTPAMLADLLGVSVAVIRRWRRRGLIVPAREVLRLPYFDFQEISTAQHLAQLVAAGASPAAIEKKLAALANFVPGVERPLAQLSVIVQGQQLLLRQGEGLIEPGGQLRINFDAFEMADTEVLASESEGSLTILPLMKPDIDSPDELRECAARLEDEGQLDAAAEMYRATLAAGGPSAEVSFLLAELLYRLDDVTAARERYYVAVELDEDYVEARANLGCVLAETGQLELAVAAFQGALEFHDDYPDVHYHLARTLDELDRLDDAEEHWRRFLALAPDSPWADEARGRLDDWSS